jgi:hypothetical protein
MKAIIDEATSMGLSRSDIVRIVEVDPSTVRNWYSKNVGSLSHARVLVKHLDDIRLKKSISQPTALKKERDAEFVRWVEEGKRFGFICPFAISNVVKSGAYIT